ncbi:MAG: D-alanyl-D-alanine carboxypeptidase/D-alanyl-D-alanine-endopeptidase [Acidobacteriota bacterium]
MIREIKLFSVFALIALCSVGAEASAQQTAKPTPTPAISQQPSPSPSPIAVETLDQLTAKIRAKLQRPEVRRGQVGIKIVSLNSGRVVFEENAEKYFMPASNMKNFTVATAIEKLTPDFRFVTSVLAAAPVDPSGTVKGDLRIFGRGDVSISTSFSEGNYYKGLDGLADKIVAAGVKRIDGGLIGDETYFRGSPVPGTWEWDDLQWYYGAEISALPLNDNAVDLTVMPGTSGSACAVNVSPSNTVLRVLNQCTTVEAAGTRDLTIEKKVDRNMLEIRGTLPVGDRGFTGNVTVSRPAELFIALLRQRLEQKGVVITGQTRLVNSRSTDPVPETVEVARLESPPLSLIAAKTMKPSQNMYTETLLWTIGEEARRHAPVVAGVPPASPTDSSELGLAEVKSFLTSIGVAPDGIIQHDGSGLSRHDLITPAAVVQLYLYMGKQSKYSQVWRDSLTIAGVDGTLKSRLTGTKAAGNLRGKTGTIDQVSALSGYMSTAAGEQVIVSFVVNGVNVGRERTKLIDEIVVDLANFNGKIDQ